VLAVKCPSAFGAAPALRCRGRSSATATEENSIALVVTSYVIGSPGAKITVASVLVLLGTVTLPNPRFELVECPEDRRAVESPTVAGREDRRPD
jgi:hypothetical protein